MFSRLRTALSANDPTDDDQKIELTVRGDDGPQELIRLLNTIRANCSAGSGTTITVETGGGVQGTFYLDGDGSDKIPTLIFNGQPYDEKVEIT